MMDFNVDYESFFRQVLGEHLQLWLDEVNFLALGGSTFSQSAKIETAEGDFFIKFSEQLSLEIYQKEKKGLEALKSYSGAMIPKVFGYGEYEQHSYLLMEYVATTNPSSKSWEQLAEQMATMHTVSERYFGWDTANFIGSLPQSNATKDHWADFYSEERLKVQVGKALYEENIPTALANKFDRLYLKLDRFFPEERSSLLHGDFWSGNVLHRGSEPPLWIDPSVYFGHREYDIAFSQLFGGIDARFYEVYQSLFPIEPGFEDRIPMYQLYPLLVHHNLFGGSYLQQIDKILNRYV